MEVLIGGKRFGGFDQGGRGTEVLIRRKRYGGFDQGEEIWRF